MYVCMVITCSKSMDQPGKVTNPARGQLNRENNHFPVPVRARESGLARRLYSILYCILYIWCNVVRGTRVPIDH